MLYEKEEHEEILDRLEFIQGIPNLKEVEDIPRRKWCMLAMETKMEYLERGIEREQENENFYDASYLLQIRDFRLDPGMKELRLRMDDDKDSGYLIFKKK